jgi:hypothetical protein
MSDTKSAAESQYNSDAVGPPSEQMEFESLEARVVWDSDIDDGDGMVEAWEMGPEKASDFSGPEDADPDLDEGEEGDEDQAAAEDA